MPNFTADDAQTRVNLSIPVFVAHDGKRDGGAEWNEGTGNNQGAILTVTRDMAKFGSVTTYLGGLAGGYVNSEGRDSKMIGGVAGASVPVGQTNFQAYAEIMVGGVSGYGKEPEKFAAGAALVGGLRYEFQNATLDLLKNASVGISTTLIPSRLRGDPANALGTGITFSKSF